MSSHTLHLLHSHQRASELLKINEMTDFYDLKAKPFPTLEGWRAAESALHQGRSFLAGPELIEPPL